MDKFQRNETLLVLEGANVEICSARFEFIDQAGKAMLYAVIRTVPENLKRIQRDFHSPVVDDDGKVLDCSFCGKSQMDVTKLIAGPGVYVCNECIDICNEIIADKPTKKSKRAK